MASAIVTLGYSVAGGFQAGTSKIATLGYVSGEVSDTTASRICIRNAALNVASATASIKIASATTTLENC